MSTRITKPQNLFNFVQQNSRPPIHHISRPIHHTNPYRTARLSTMSTAGMASQPRRFAPLDESKSKSDGSGAPRLKGVVFDVDGTLCLPQNYMFKEMRTALNIPKSVDIIEHINSLSSEPDTTTTDTSPTANSSPRSRAQEAIKQIERTAMSHQTPQPGLNELLTYLSDTRGLRIGICTRNFEMPVTHLLNKFVGERVRHKIHPIITRETVGVRPKPTAEGVWACVEAWEADSATSDASKQHETTSQNNEDGAADEVGITPKVHDSKRLSEETKTKMCEGVIMVGDSVDDIEAGARAGAATVLLVNDENRHLLDGDTKWPKRVDLGIGRLDDLIGVLEEGFCGRGGG